MMINIIRIMVMLSATRIIMTILKTVSTITVI